ncbi:phosphoadenylyl-sulfate reductase [Cyclobacterium amurskyense]|jgi:phosphoadenosine phosphosulfate reductase|uniref:Adenosine 5'-phosphosulfate reductase n=1 Tax=Cyclobacterium amurskyense TaxID=320787 RepID=A0A0H4PB79_9BACT|nr:phosphoadenylyl-sulfate reductase [Cyclobacterium amurskyense]AKP50405.1 Adenylylsulfate reductase, thioredoxin dependent [Cyclobacterium amurskyense]|tara:strand:+ start:5840 stop:6568 length:729 start_codon:yes stop_codon:yes gene_type:complete
MIEASEIKELTQRIEKLSMEEAMGLLVDLFPGEIIFSTSFGQEDQVITQKIAANKFPIEVFTLDTGRLFYETYDLWSRTIVKYGLSIKPFYPETAAVEELISTNGINGFYQSVENRKSCCYVRKVAPLKRALNGKKVWITGLRSEQSPNRQNMDLLEWDEGNQILKYNPLLHWTMEDMLAYIKEKSIPYNTLHDKGFVSIGCAPCTRAIMPGEDARAGRWWWEASHKECGLHEHRATANKSQ